MAVLLVACGGSSEEQFANEPAGSYPVNVIAARFPARQLLDENAFLRLGVRNVGRKAIPALAVTITIAGREGIASVQPFSIRDPQPGLSIPDRPVWLLDRGYPKTAGTVGPGGATTANQKTFDFGRLNPGDARLAVWKLAAVKAGSYKLRYRINAGLSGEASAVTVGGGPPAGTFAVRIISKPQLQRINSKGQIVPVAPAAVAQAGATGTPSNPNATSGYADSGSGSYPPSGSLPPSGSGN